MIHTKTLKTFCIFFFTISTFVYGQQFSRDKLQEICEVSGTVIDSLTGLPIEYASVSILLEDGEIETGGVTGKSGTFQIDKIKPGIYSLKIEFMGYASVDIPNIKFSFQGPLKKNIGTIKLIQIMIPIKGATVIEDRPIFEFKTDKMIYNSSDDIVAGSGTAEDVLNKIPMVTVDQDGQVALRGNPNVKILINGRPNRSGGDVDNIPASIIEKVEVITSPSAKYDPEGMAGIINIVLIEGRFEGMNGSIKINAKHNKYNSMKDMNGVTFYSNYQTDNYNVYSTYSVNNRKRTQEGFRRVYSIYSADNSIVYAYDYNFLGDSDAFGQSFKIGTDFSLTETLKLNAEAIYKNHYKTKSNTQKYLWNGTNEDPYDPRLVEKSSEGEDKDNFHSEIFLELLRSFENPDKEISLSFAYDYGKDFEFEMSDEGDRTNIDEIEGSHEIDFNYKLPINENSNLEFGYDGRFKNSQEDMNFVLSGGENDETWRFSGLIDFDYSRSIHGFFSEYQLELNEKLSIKPSFRLEYVAKNITFDIKDSISVGQPESIFAELLKRDIDKSTNVKEINYFPDFHFVYNLTNKKSIQFGVSKRIERPGGGGHGGAWGQLRPFPRNIYNESFVMIGNPNLKPEFSTQYEITYKSAISRGFYYTNVYYRDVIDPVEWFNDKDFNTDSTRNAVTFINADSGTDYGVAFFFMIMGQTFGGGYNINELKDASGDFQLNGKNEFLNMYMRINLPEKYIKLFSYEFGFYYMKMKQPGGTLFGDRGTLWANTGISKSLFDDRASLSFSINNIFDMGGFQMDYLEPIGGGFSEKTEIQVSRGGRTFSVSLKYNFGKMQDEKRRQGRGMKKGGDEGMMDMGY